MAAIIKKMPSVGKDFKNYLNHKQKEIIIEDLVVRLRIEEDNKWFDEKEAHTSTKVKANFMELGQGSKTKKHNKGKGSKLGPKGGALRSKSS